MITEVGEAVAVLHLPAGPTMLLKRLATIAYLAVLLLVFVGAIVRATGSGLGCPDWPFCYGRAIPPTSAEQIDFEHLDIERFRRKAAQHGRDPASITPATIRAEFNATHTWIEYINRLTSMPVGLSALALLIASFLQRKRFPSVHVAAWLALLLVLFNAWLGARVVYSGLKPGIITLHMALAIVLLCVLVFAMHRSGFELSQSGIESRMFPRQIALWLFAAVVAEGVLGSQVREMTDMLAKTHLGQPRSAWVTELEQTWVYLVHRSASWLIVGAGVVFFIKNGHRTFLEKAILGLILAQMVLGVILAHVGIVPTAQILHIGLSSLLVSGLFLWLLQTAHQKSSHG